MANGVLENGYGKRLEDKSGKGCEFGHLLKQAFDTFTAQYAEDRQDFDVQYTKDIGFIRRDVKVLKSWLTKLFLAIIGFQSAVIIALITVLLK